MAFIALHIVYLKCCLLVFVCSFYRFSTCHINFLTVCSCHVTYAFQSESTIYSCLNVKELLARSRCEIWSLGDCNWTRTQNHLVRKRTLYHVECSFTNYVVLGLSPVAVTLSSVWGFARRDNKMLRFSLSSSFQKLWKKHYPIEIRLYLIMNYCCGMVDDKRG